MLVQLVFEWINLCTDVCMYVQLFVWMDEWMDIRENVFMSLA